MEDTKTKTLLILDCNSILHRAFYALPELTAPDGQLVNAAYGFCLVFFRVIKEFKPDYIAATFDYPAPSFREKISKQYKAKRPPIPQPLSQQIPKIKKILQAFNVPIFEKPGFEADDVIGTIVKLAKRQQVIPPINIIIVSGDTDILQLVDKRTKVYLLKRGVKEILVFDEQKVRQKYGGLGPEQLVDFKALCGDPSDNIPGVTGIGPKTAQNLLLKFDSLENLYKRIEEDKASVNPKWRDTLCQYKDQAFLSKSLAQIDKNVDLNFNINQCCWLNPNPKTVTPVLTEFGFVSLIRRLPELELK